MFQHPVSKSQGWVDTANLASSGTVNHVPSCDDQTTWSITCQSHAAVRSCEFRPWLTVRSSSKDSGLADPPTHGPVHLPDQGKYSIVRSAKVTNQRSASPQLIPAAWISHTTCPLACHALHHGMSYRSIPLFFWLSLDSRRFSQN